MLGLFSVAIHIDGQGGISQLGEHVGAPADVIVVPPPFMNHDDAGPPALKGIIERMSGVR
jgi:hypothetical protein